MLESWVGHGGGTCRELSVEALASASVSERKWGAFTLSLAREPSSFHRLVTPAVVPMASQQVVALSWQRQGMLRLKGSAASPVRSASKPAVGSKDCLGP